MAKDRDVYGQTTRDGLPTGGRRRMGPALIRGDRPYDPVVRRGGQGREVSWHELLTTLPLVDLEENRQRLCELEAFIDQHGQVTKTSFERVNRCPQLATDGEWWLAWRLVPGADQDNPGSWRLTHLGVVFPDDRPALWTKVVPTPDQLAILDAQSR